MVAGNLYTCALRADATVACWGDGYSGELGDGINAVTTAAPTPLAINSLGTLKSIAVNSQNGCAVDLAGATYCWGWGGLGVTAQDPGNPAPMAVSPRQVTGVPAAKAVALGYAFACVLTTSNTVWCWGAGATGQMGRGPSSTTSTISAPGAVSGLTNVQQLSIGSFTACALISGGSLKCWGSNVSGLLGAGADPNTTPYADTPTPVSNATLGPASTIAVGPNNACAVSGTTGTGGLFCWGDTTQGQLGNNPLYPPGPDAPSQASPRSVATLTSGVTGAAVGSAHTCALLTGGGVKCVGSDAEGQLGDGAPGSSGNNPVTVAASGYSAIAAGLFHTCGITSGTVKCWGDNSLAQLGDGTFTSRNAPTAVSGLTGITNIGGGIANTCATSLTSGAGPAWCWGDGYYGQLGDGRYPTGHAGLSGVVRTIANFSLRVAPVTPPPGGTTPDPPVAVPTIRVVNGKLALTAFVLNPLGKSCPSRVTIKVSVGKVKQTARGKTTATTTAGKLSCTVTFKFKLSSKVKKVGRKAKRVTVQVSGSGVATTRTRVKWAS